MILLTGICSFSDFRVTRATRLRPVASLRQPRRPPKDQLPDSRLGQDLLWHHQLHMVFALDSNVLQTHLVGTADGVDESSARLHLTY